jgi:hypothetical protein
MPIGPMGAERIMPIEMHPIIREIIISKVYFLEKLCKITKILRENTNFA